MNPATTAALFQAANPKAWLFALGAISTFHPSGDPGRAGSLLVAAVMMLVVVPAAAIWAGAGGFIGRSLTSPRPTGGQPRARRSRLLTIATVRV